MRQFTPHTNLLLTWLAAIGLVLSLGLPWYGSAPSISDSPGEVGTIAGPIEGAARLVSRWLDPNSTGTTGTEALGLAEVGLLGLAALAIVLAAAMLVPVLRRAGRQGLRLFPLAAPALVVLQMVDPSVAGAELRWGAFTALFAGLMMASAAWHGASLPLARKAAAPTTSAYVPPAPASSVAPPSV